MASNIKVDVVRPTATNGSLALKGDSGGSATTNGVTVDSSGNTSITGTTTVSSLVATTADINGGTIDGADITGGTIDNATIGGTTPAAGTFTTLDVSDTANQNAILRVTNNDGNAEMQKYQDDLYLNLNDTGDIIIRSGSNTVRMRIDSSGNVRANSITDLAGNGAPNFPNGISTAAICFSGQLTTTATATGVLPLNTATLDPSSAYSSNTFTPPIDGKYLLTLSGHIVKGAANTGHYSQLIIKVDASEVAKSADLGYGDAATVREQGAVSVVADLTTSSAVTFECLITGTVSVISGSQTIGTAIYIGN